MFAKPLYKMTGPELELAVKSTRSPEALLALSVMVAQGWRGLDGDEDRALELEKLAAAMGHPRALCKLGDRYARGDVVEEDQEQAVLWWQRAAAAGHPGALSNLTMMRSAATMAEFASLSLEEMAARAPAPTGNELAWNCDAKRASVRQMNDLVGLFVERLRAHFFDVHTVTTIDGDNVDFPQPDIEEIESLVAEENTIEVMVYAGRLHLMIDLFPDEDRWTIDASSFEPHPSGAEQQWLITQIVETMRQVGLRV